jgi:hypothetical protein
MKTSAKTWLRGDPDRPVPADDPERPDLLRRYVGPTHEPLWFYRIRGSCTPAEEARSRGYATAENVEVMHRLGLQYARELHRRGMRVSVYVGGTMFTEYFFQEVPEARGWARSAASVEQVRCDEENHPSSQADVTIEAGEAVFRMFTPRVYGLARVRFGR